ncbi:hypothetical protein ACSBR2_040447 [Camellia fascicularis]
MKEMVLAKIGQFSGRSLLFGALFTKIFKHFKIRLVGEPETKISSAISEYTVTRAGGAANLMESLTADVPSDDAPEDDPDIAMPSTEPPQYWTDFLAIQEERHNQRMQWEQQMANQVSALGTQFDALGNQFDAFATA